MHGQHQRQAGAGQCNGQAPGTHRDARQQAVARDRCRIHVAVGIVQLVQQDQAQRQQATLCHQQRSHQTRIRRRDADHQHPQRVAPSVGQCVAQPGAAQRAAAVDAMAGVVGHQWQPGHGHGDHQVNGGPKPHAAVTRALPEGVKAFVDGQAAELPGEPQQRQHHQRQAKAAYELAHQGQHGAHHQQRQHAAPQQRGPDQAGLARRPTQGLGDDGLSAFAHDHQLKRGPAQQLDNVEQNRQPGKGAAKNPVHQPGAGQAAVAAQFGRPGQQARPQDRAQHDGQQGVLRTHRGDQIGAHLHHQQANAKAEPE